MKITSIRVRAVNIPTVKSYHVAVLGTINSTQSVVVELQTDEGIVGVGETDPALMFTGESQQTVMVMLKHHIGPAILGMDPLRIESMHQRMNKISLGNPFAKAAIDLACHDLVGKVHDMPVYQLFGGLVHERIPVMWSLGSEPPEVNARDALEKVAEGYQTIGLKLGILPPEEDIKRVSAVRRAVGEKIKLRCDANQSWRVGTAIRIIRRLSELGVVMIEQPVSKYDLDGMGRVAAAVDIPVGADESLSSIQDALRIIQFKAADFFSIKTTKQGGLHNAQKIAALVETAGSRIFVNSMIEMGISTMSSLHFAAATPNLFEIGQAINSVRRLQDDILKEPVLYDGGDILVPLGRKGLGVDLDEAKMDHYTVGEFLVKA